jgi:hypothetical protein
MFCPSCGAETTGQVRFCRACGKPLNTSNANPYETKMGQDQPSAQSQPGADPFKTVVAMQAPPKAAPKPSAPPTPPPAAANEPDPFATQVSPSFNAADVAKELAKAKAAKQPPPPPPSAEIDQMKTVVGMQAPVIPKPTPPAPAPPPKPGPDPMATMVAMPAVSMPPKKPVAPAAESPKPEVKAEPKPEPKPEPAKPAVSTSNAPFAQTSVPQNYDPLSTLSNEEKKSGSMMYVVIGAVILVILIGVFLALK